MKGIQKILFSNYFVTLAMKLVIELLSLLSTLCCCAETMNCKCFICFFCDVLVCHDNFVWLNMSTDHIRIQGESKTYKIPTTPPRPPQMHYWPLQNGASFGFTIYNHCLSVIYWALTFLYVVLPCCHLLEKRWHPGFAFVLFCFTFPFLLDV